MKLSLLTPTALAATLTFTTTTGLFALAPTPAHAQQPQVAAGPLRSYSTYHSMGFEWDVAGDANHNARVAVRYRKKGDAAYQDAMDLLRIDWQGYMGRDEKTGETTLADRPYNMLAGSILFLQPATTYEVELTLADPDNPAVVAPAVRNLTLTTRTAPRLDGNAPRLYVSPGAKGGNGSATKPFGTLADAQTAAKPGDIVMLGAGNYGDAALDKAGEVGKPIAYVAAPGTLAQFNALNVNADNLWIDGLTFRPLPGVDKGGLKANETASNVVVRGCDFDGHAYSITLGWQAFNQNWTIVDNTIVGSKTDITETGVQGGFKGEGVELAKTTGGHVVAYNRISRTADGISYTRTNCDLFGNDIFDTSDDGIEMDFGYSNNRAWENRISNFHNYALSFQPVNSGPWYFVRNQIVGPRGGIFKFVVTHRFVVVGNTFAAPRFGRDAMGFINNAVSRNNLFITLPDEDKRPAWSATPRYQGNAIINNTSMPDQFAPDWKTDVDFDGFALQDPATAFRLQDNKIIDYATFKTKSGLEANSKLVNLNALLQGYPTPQSPANNPYPPLVPTTASGAVDAGVVVPNLDDNYVGAAPDLGAQEAGRPAPHYGPRAGYKLGDPLF